jgi:hypothetical protein
MILLSLPQKYPKRLGGANAKLFILISKTKAMHKQGSIPLKAG